MKSLRSIAIVSVGRSDYGILRPLLCCFEGKKELAKARLLVSGAHLSRDGGSTIQDIRADGFHVAAEIPVDSGAGGAKDVARSIAQGVSGFATAFASDSYDLAILLGDRFEMYAAAVAAYTLGLPIAHLHGGELTFGAMDEAFRHSITKLSHLHFPSTAEYARRIVQLGEEPWRVTVAGAMGIDALLEAPVVSAEEMTERTGLDLQESPLLVTFHPATLERMTPLAQITELLAALERTTQPVLFTAPNADPGATDVRCAIERFVSQHPRAKVVYSLGTKFYAGILRCAAAMIGNSSSGIIEAPSFGLPVVNIGSRQDGRIRGANVIDCLPDRAAIGSAISRALAPSFREQARRSSNPYARSGSADIVAARLISEPLNSRLMNKRFYDLKFPVAAAAPGRVPINV